MSNRRDDADLFNILQEPSELGFSRYFVTAPRDCLAEIINELLVA